MNDLVHGTWGIEQTGLESLASWHNLACLNEVAAPFGGARSFARVRSVTSRVATSRTAW